MNLFSSKIKVDPLIQLEKESEGAVDIFIETMEKLETVNQKIDSEVEIRNNKVSKLIEENTKLSERKRKNTLFLDKLNIFLGEMPAVNSQDDQDSRDEEINSEA